MKLDLQDQLWFGTQASLDAALELESLVEAKLRAGFSADSAADSQDSPYLLQKVGKVGVVSIKGPLLNSDNPILAYFGVSTYPAIRQAMIAAAKDPEIEQILLNVDSGGGAVNGAADTGDLIARIDKKVKPVTTYAGGTMASAAYWLGVSASKRYAAKTSTVGSIGVLAIHMDFSQQLKNDGVKPTVIRSGKYKALGTGVEPLSDTAKAQMQASVDAGYKVFGDHVANALGMSFDQMDKKVGQGREFFGQAAVDAGLVDGLSTLDAVLSKLAGAKTVDKKSPLYDNVINKGAAMAQATLTDKDIAALAEGATAALEARAGEVDAAKLAADAAAKVVADAAAKVVADAAAAKLVADAASAETAKTAADKAAADKLVADKAAADAAALAAQTDAGAVATVLRAQLKEKDDALIVAAVAKKELEAKITTMEATHVGLLDIARGSIGRMRVALGGSAEGSATLAAADVLTQHAALSADFKKKFKVGGVAAVSVDDKGNEKHAVDPLHAAKVAATRRP